MKIGFIINDLHSMNLAKDTSVYLMKEAFMRGNEVFAFDATDVTHKNSSLYARCTKIVFPNPAELIFPKIPPMCPFSTASGLIIVNVLFVAILIYF